MPRWRFSLAAIITFLTGKEVRPHLYLASLNGVTIPTPQEDNVDTLRANPKVLLNAIALVEPYVGKHSSISVLKGVKVSQHAFALEVEATDMESYAIATDKPVGCNYGSWVIPPKALKDALEGMKSSEVVTITGRDENSVEVTDGVRHTILNVLPATDFVERPNDSNHKFRLQFDQKVLSEALAWVLPAVSRDPTRPLLNGLCIRVRNGFVTFAATDSYRLHYQLVPTAYPVDAPGKDYVIPLDCLLAVAKQIAKTPGIWTIEVGDNDKEFARARIVSPSLNLEVRSRLIDGQYPNYQQLVPDIHEGFMVVADASELAAAVVPCQKLLKNANAPVRFSLAPQDDPCIAEISCERQDVGSAMDSITVDVEDERLDKTGRFEIGLNPDFFLQAVKMAKETFCMYFISPLRPVTYFADDVSRQGLLMPIRLND